MQAVAADAEQRPKIVRNGFLLDKQQVAVQYGFRYAEQGCRIEFHRGGGQRTPLFPAPVDLSCFRVFVASCQQQGYNCQGVEVFFHLSM